MNCYACGEAAVGRCGRCGRAYCPRHGPARGPSPRATGPGPLATGGRCERCRLPEHAVPSSLLYRGTVVLAALSLILAVWHLAAWPQFPAPPFLQPGLTAAAARVVSAPPIPTAEPVRPVIQETAVASPTPTPTPEPPASQRTYTVQPRDTLFSIAGDLGVDADAIIEANGLANPQALSIGQELVIP